MSSHAPAILMYKKLAEIHFAQKFRAEVQQVRSLDREEDGRLLEAITRSEANSGERARLLSEYIRRFNDYSDLVADFSDNDQLALARYDAENALSLISIDFQEYERFHATIDSGVERFHSETEYNAGVARKVGDAIIQYDSVIESLVSAAALLEEAGFGLVDRQKDIDNLQSQRIEKLRNEWVDVHDGEGANRGLFFGELSPEEQLKVVNDRPRFAAKRLSNEERGLLIAELRYRVEARTLARAVLQVEELAVTVGGILLSASVLDSSSRNLVSSSLDAYRDIFGARAAMLDSDLSDSATANAIGDARAVLTAATAVADGLVGLDIVDRESAEDVQKLLRIGVSAADVVTRISSASNPALIVAGVASVLGIGGPGSRAVMDELARITQRLDAIDKKLDAIDAKVVEVLNLQKRTLASVLALEAAVLQEFERLRIDVENLAMETIVNRQLIIETSELGLGITKCVEAAHERRHMIESEEFVASTQTTPNLPFTMGRFSDWNSLVEYYNMYRKVWWEPCFGAIISVFRDGIHPLLSMATYADRDARGNYSHYYENVFKVLSRLLADSFPVDISRESTENDLQRAFNVLCALINSPLSYEGIGHRGDIAYACRRDEDESKLDPIAALGAELVTGGPWEPVPLIHPNALLFYSYLLMEILPYYSLIDDEHRVLSIEDILNRENETDGARNLIINSRIKTAYRLVNIAIAQQVLLSGDILLPVIHRTLLSAPEGSSRREEMIELLREHSSHMGKNYVIVRFRSEMNRSVAAIDYKVESVFARNMEEYAGLYRCRERGRSGHECGTVTVNGYEDLFSSYWEFDADGNEVILGNGGLEDDSLTIEMPTPEEIDVGLYHVPREYYELVVLRDRLIEYGFRSRLAFADKVESIVDPEGNYLYF